MRFDRASGRRPAARPPRVLLAVQPSDGVGNPYGDLLAASLRSRGCSVEAWSWHTALFGHYDVAHLHWPEGLLRSRSNPKLLLKRCAFAVLLLRWAIGRTAVVETIHNESPHEPGNRAEAVLLGWKNHLVCHWIAINSTTVPREPATTVILHGHYRDVYQRRVEAHRGAGTLLFFGMIRAYKGVPELISAFRNANAAGEGWSLRVIGAPISPDLKAQVMAAVGNERNAVSYELSEIADSDLVAEVSAAEAVILPYRRLFNSGVALTALSLDVPVIMPDVPASAALQQEIGSGWVILYEEPLTANGLLDALRTLRLRQANRGERPGLSLRDWSLGGRLHLDVYNRALSAKRA